MQPSFRNPLKQKQTNGIVPKTIQHIKQPSPYTYSLLSNSESNISHSSFQQVSLPRVLQISQQSPQKSVQQFQNPQSFIHKTLSVNKIEFHPFVDQTSVELKNGPQTFHANQQMSHTSNPSFQKHTTQDIQPARLANFQPSQTSDQSSHFQTFASNNPMLEKENKHNINHIPAQEPLEVKNLPNIQNTIVPKGNEVQIGTPPRFVFNINERPLQHTSNQPHPFVQNQTPISVSPNTNNGQLTIK